MKKAPVVKIIRNEKGILTLDFIFAITVAACFGAIFMAISFTLSMVEVGQYVTFAVSRTYMGAHNTPGDQAALAKAKYDELVNTPGVLSNLLHSGWVTLGEPQTSDFGDEYPGSGNDADVENHRYAFVGARIPFTAQVLHLQMPILGNATEDSGTGKATLNSYLMREVSTSECQQNFSEPGVRFKALQGLSDAYSKAQASPQAIMDNGC